MKMEELLQDQIVTNRKRGILELRTLIVDELTDEEMVRVIRDKYKSRFALIAYESEGEYLFLSAFKDKIGNQMIKQLQTAFEEKYGRIEIL